MNNSGELHIYSSKFSGSSDVFEPTNVSDDDLDAQSLIGWINNILPNLNLPSRASIEELRSCLVDGTVLLQILNKLKPSSLIEKNGSDTSPSSPQENVSKFLATMDELMIPRFRISELEKGSMSPVMDCLLRLKAKFSHAEDKLSAISTTNRGASPQGLTSPQSGEESQKVPPESKFQRPSHSTFTPDTPTALMHHAGHKFHEVFQLKQRRYADLSAAKISEMMKSNSLDNAPTQSLLSVVNGILDESIERKNGEIPHRVACLLRKVVQEIERRISTQAEHLRTQNNLFKAREEKYHSRLRVLEALASGTCDTEKSTTDETKKVEEEYVIKLMKEKEQTNIELSTLKRELDIAKKEYENEKSKMDGERKNGNEDMIRLMKEKALCDHEISTLRQELEIAKKTHEFEKSGKDEERRVEEEYVIKLMNEKEQANVALLALKEEFEILKKTHDEAEREAKNVREDFEKKIKDLEHVLEDSRNKLKELETDTDSKNQLWSKKELIINKLVEFQSSTIKELKFSSNNIKCEVLKAQQQHLEEFSSLGLKFKPLIDASETYHLVLAENRKMFNELQDLKGNIRVYCRIRPLLTGQDEKQMTIEHIGNNGELVVANPSKPGKDGHRLFRFNKVYGPDSTQGEVFSDTQPLIRCVLDGYNVCIFAYGQTGSGKTHTMTGPDGATEEEWGVNYRALNDLFNISRNRSNLFTYEIGVQMFEIYNEQLRDLLDSSQKRLGIKSNSQSSGLVVPDAIMHHVTSTADVIELMEIGLSNRAVGATALNERSSRSHSVVSIHVSGKDLQGGTTLQGNLHLVDLAGSERVDRSEVTGDRLREAQHINKSLSALGDVIFSLAQKSSHVPYRNSKLTQLLQASLGGQAKTLMFVQLNPDLSSYSETMSTLKFAERVSGVELGAARSSKEGNIKELMEQVTTLKDTIAKKDGEIERLQLLKDLKNVFPGSSGEKQGTNLLKHGYSSTSSDLIERTQKSQRSSITSLEGSQKSIKSASNHGNNSEHSDIHSEDVEILGYGDGDGGDRSGEISDGGLSAGTEFDASADESTIPLHKSVKRKVPSKIQSVQKLSPPTLTVSRDSTRASTSLKKSTTGNSITVKSTKRWQ